MTTPYLSKRGEAFVAAVIAAYDAGDSYDTVARERGIKPGVVQTIMRRFSPGSIRKQGQQKKRPVVKEFGITLASLGLSRVGPCKGTRFSSCGIPLVAPTRQHPVKGQTCGLCRAYAAERRAA